MSEEFKKEVHLCPNKRLGFIYSEVYISMKVKARLFWGGKVPTGKCKMYIKWF
jgi:hypothetical protein